jgi:hypothetical protein
MRSSLPRRSIFFLYSVAAPWHDKAWQGRGWKEEEVVRLMLVWSSNNNNRGLTAPRAVGPVAQPGTEISYAFDHTSSYYLCRFAAVAAVHLQSPSSFAQAGTW